MTDQTDLNMLSDASFALSQLQAIVGEVNREHGFREHADQIRDDPDALVRAQANALMLIVGEASEAHEELRKGKPADETYYPTAPLLNGRPWTLPKGTYKPEGVPSEIADIVIRCLDFADNFGFDLGEIVAEKIRYNTTRPFKHGKQF